MPAKRRPAGTPSRGQGIRKRGQKTKEQSKVSDDIGRKRSPNINSDSPDTKRRRGPRQMENQCTILYQREEAVPNDQVPVVDMGTTETQGTANAGMFEDAPGGGNIEFILDREPVSMESAFDQIGSHVPQKLKEKIWEGKFIDFSLLLKSARELNNAIDFTGDLIFRDGKLVVEKQTQQKPIYNISSWTSAFIIFMSVIIEKHPGKSQELLKYLRDVRLAAIRAPSASAWVHYDEQYRLKKSKNPSSSWGVIDSELWLICMSSQKGGNNASLQSQVGSGSSDSFRNRNGSSNARQNICWAFNRGNCKFYPRCKFIHVCSKCGEKHPATRCDKH